ncbi:hypothetical protein QQ045_000716 [Rhodiola kirilowii]
MPMLVSSKAELKRREKQQKKANSCGFESLGFSSNVFRGIKRKGYRVPTPIQRKTMPLIMSGADVVAMARTGSGKTAAFLLPMLERLKQHVPQGGVRALVLSPTRDLALQTLKFAKELGRFTDLRISLLVGGDSMEGQFEELAQSPDIIIATPGRLMHHLSEVEDMTLRTVEYVVFDEADCLFEMGFAEQLHQILTQLNENRQTLLFSATMPSALAEFAKAGLREPQLVRLDLETRISPDLTLKFFTLRHEEKCAALIYLVKEEIRSDEQTLIFVSTKHHVEFLNSLFREEGIEPSICYGDMDQDARKMNVARFRSRKTMLLIVTDVAARGIDIPLLDNVINWDFPPKPKMFVHRVGRAARAGRTGSAYSFVTSEDLSYVLDLHLFLSKPIKAAPSEEEVMQNYDAVMSKLEQDTANGDTIYGRFPQTALDLISDRLRDTIDSSAELYALQVTCNRAFRLYSKTKPAPSKESIKRAKTLPREGLHPMFKKLLKCGELSALAFSERLKNFKPKQTILEAEGEAAKSKHLKGSSSTWVDVMKRKREIHEGVINLVQKQRASSTMEQKPETIPEIPSSIGSEKKGRASKRKAAIAFKDDEYFISAVPSNHHMEAGFAVQGGSSNRLESAVLDLVADDGTGMKKQKSTYHWDKRHKKYIKLNNGDRVTASGKVKTEGGSKVKADKTGIYKRWVERSHRKIGNSNGDEDNNVSGGYLGRNGNNRGFGGRPNRSAHGHSEKKNHDQGRKEKPDRRFGGKPNRKNPDQVRKEKQNKGSGGRPNRNGHIPNAHVRSEIKNPDQIRKERQKKADRITQLKNKPKGKFGGKKRGKPRKK